MAETEDTQGVIAGIGWLRLAAVVVLAAAAGFVGWLLIKGDGGDDGAGKNGAVERPQETTVAASLEDLEALPASVGHPVYWAGAKAGFTYELTKTDRGNVYIRYLPPGVAVDDMRPEFLTIGTYPYPNAIDAARTQAERPGAFSRSIAGRGIAYSLPKNRESVYFTYPRLGYLYEVYDPRPLRARRLVLSGRVRPIG